MDDKQSILDIERNAFGGMDYLPHWLDRFLVAPNRRCFVGEVGKEVMFYAQCTTLDGGKRCLYQGGRIKKAYRGNNMLWKLVHTAGEAYLEEFPSNQQFVYTLHNRNAAVMRDSFWDTRRVKGVRLLTNFVVRDRLQLASSLASTASSKVTFSDLTRQELTEMCHKHKHLPQLFHSKFMIVFYEPFELMASNVDEIFSKLTYAKRSTTGDANDASRVTGISFLVESPCGQGRRRVDLDIYSSDTQTVIDHVDFYLNHVVQSEEKYTPFMSISVSKSCDYHRIVDHLNSLRGLERGPLYSATEILSMADF